MSLSELNIHTPNNETLKVTVEKYSDFYDVEIDTNIPPTIKFFIYSEQQMINFKNNFLWAFENPIDIK